MHFFNLTLLIMIDKYVHIIIEKYHICSEICQIDSFSTTNSIFSNEFLNIILYKSIFNKENNIILK